VTRQEGRRKRKVNGRQETRQEGRRKRQVNGRQEKRQEGESCFQREKCSHMFPLMGESRKVIPLLLSMFPSLH